MRKANDYGEWMMKKIYWKKKTFWYLAAAIVILALILLSMITGKIVEWLWMSQLGYVSIFWRILSIKLLLFGLAFVIVFLYFWVNLRLVLPIGSKAIGTRRFSFEREEIGGVPLKPRYLGIIATLISLVPALIFGLIFYSQWDTYLRFHWGGSYGEADPLFGLDIGFYLFHLPFYELIQNSLLGLTLITFLMISLIYGSLGFLQWRRRSPQERNWRVIGHVSILFLLFIVAWSWGYYLDRYQLLYSTSGVVYGAGYTDYNVVRIGLWIMLFASVVLSFFLLFSFFARRFRWMRAGGAGYFALMIVLLFFLPALVQRFKVQPNELELETPFLKHNIEFTRKAYQLDRIEERKYPALGDLTLRNISQNQDTIRNIRLWDWRPIRQTFRQTQEIRLYYQFYEVDVDRYHLNGEGYRQVMLSGRELVENLPQQARTWVNQRLQFTHGYGLAMAFVSEKVEGGFPRYVMKDLPPVSPYLKIEWPAIYYGEKTPGYRIVNTTIKEFDYPKGDQNVYVNYEGEGGIPLNSFWKRLLFTWDLSDINILISSYITSESRVQIWRRIQDRVSRIVPFLQLDKDPYLVLSEGKLYWIQDAYTLSSNFPYSEPYRESFRLAFNYIRNSVKVIVDAYEGTVSFYVIDPEDSVLNAYRNAFPDVFRKLETMPDDLKAHLRYPEDLFTIQVDKFRTYHMTVPQVFYNKEDLWTFPREKYAGTPQPMSPYYILMRLPGEKKLEYIMIVPLTPENRDNMIAWVAAKSDFPDYGKLIFYQLPKERLIYGPLQIEAMIDQDDVISRQLSLWDQRGSRVIRGNLLVIPLDHSFIYVEPVYLVAEERDIPQLKRVIMVYGKKVVMEPTIDEAVRAVFGGPRRPEKKAPVVVEKEGLADQARREMEKAEEAIQRGNWAEFGEAMEQLKQLLRGARE